MNPRTALPRANNEQERLRGLLRYSVEAMLQPRNFPNGIGAEVSDREKNPLEAATEAGVAKLQDYVRGAVREVAESRTAVQAMRRSWSWRVTAPLRSGIEWLQAAAGLTRNLGGASDGDGLSGLLQWIRYRRVVRESGLVDQDYYRANHAGEAWAQANPVLHFFVRGARAGDRPNELFDTNYYVRRYLEAAKPGVNALVHYLTTGANSGCDPHPYFSSSFYLEQNPDVREGGLNPLAHFLAPGIAEGRDPNPWFDTSEYLERNPAVADFGQNPLAHYERWNQAPCSR